MDPTQLSRELRKADTPHLNRRRWIVGLSVLGTAMAQIVSLYQTGILKRLPDPPVKIFDSDRVDASDYAYSRFNSPDAPMMLMGYGMTAWLASMGGKNRARNTPIIPILMGLKILGDTALALELGREEWKENQALCAYCQVATIASLASLVLALPEVVEAAQHLLGDSQDDHTPEGLSNGVPKRIEELRERAEAFARS
jgi:uncharacterized membrane protein